MKPLKKKNNKKKISGNNPLFEKIDSKMGYLVVCSFGLIAALLIMIKLNATMQGLESMSPEEISYMMQKIKK